MRKRLLFIWPALSALALAASLAAVAASSVGSFEIDGNRADDSGPSGLVLDWDSPPSNLTTFTDAQGKNDDVFGLGSKALEPGGWKCVTGSTPSKDDIVSGQVAFRLLSGKQYLYVNFLRAGTNGDAHIDYEFNKSTEPNPACEMDFSTRRVHRSTAFLELAGCSGRLQDPARRDHRSAGDGSSG